MGIEEVDPGYVCLPKGNSRWPFRIEGRIEQVLMKEFLIHVVVTVSHSNYSTSWTPIQGGGDRFSVLTGQAGGAKVYGKITFGVDMIKRLILLFVLTNMVLFGVAALQRYFSPPEEHYSRQIDRREELIGLWRSLPLPDDMRQKLNKQDPEPATPYHALLLTEDGRLREIRSAASFGQDAAKLRKSLNRIKETSTWELVNGALTVRSPGAKQAEEQWSVFLVTKHHEKGAFVVQPGDLLMLLTNDRGQPVFYRHMRRIGD